MNAQVITSALGISILFVFLGVMLWWVQALPLIIISAVVVAMVLLDFYQTARDGNDGVVG